MSSTDVRVRGSSVHRESISATNSLPVSSATRYSRSSVRKLSTRRGSLLIRPSGGGS
ncbi:MAG TPA: hypothetical protein VFH66_09875 [Mycobacteriales bacterium]|nr:hypothetical protein [Mycobacteriales bacterium]